MDRSTGPKAHKEVPSFDLRSKWFRLSQTVAGLWVLIAAVLAWQSYPREPSYYVPGDLSSYRCDDLKIAFSPNDEITLRPAEQSEIDSCLKDAIEADWRLQKEAIQEGQADTLLWFAVWAIATSLAFLTLIASRSMLANFAAKLWRSYWRWIHAGESSR